MLLTPLTLDMNRIAPLGNSNSKEILSKSRVEKAENNLKLNKQQKPVLEQLTSELVMQAKGIQN